MGLAHEQEQYGARRRARRASARSRRGKRRKRSCGHRLRGSRPALVQHPTDRGCMIMPPSILPMLVMPPAVPASAAGADSLAMAKPHHRRGRSQSGGMRARQPARGAASAAPGTPRTIPGRRKQSAQRVQRLAPAPPVREGTQKRRAYRPGYEQERSDHGGLRVSSP